MDPVRTFRIALFGLLVLMLWVGVVWTLSLVGLVTLSLALGTALYWIAEALPVVVLATFIAGWRLDLLDVARRYGAGWVLFWRD